MRLTPAALAAVLLAGAVLQGCSRGTNVSTGDAHQVLHRGIGPDIADLDPHMATETKYYSVLSALLEGLVGEDPATLAPVPGVAEHWDISPDGLTYTFHLRADGRWSDGTPVTATDFVESWHRILSPSLGAPNASQLFVIQGAEAFSRGVADFSQVGLKARDARTLSVVLEHPAPWFLSMLSGPAWLPVPVATIAKYGGISARGVSWAVPGRWVGNGPFVLASWKHGQEIVVTRSPTYWDAGGVRLREIHFHEFESIDAEERAFRAGQLHLTETIPPDRIDSYRLDAPDLLRVDPLLGTYFIRVNVRRPGLSDGRIRQALSLAIDRDAIVEKVLRGGQTPATSLVPPGLAGYAPERERGPARTRRGPDPGPGRPSGRRRPAGLQPPLPHLREPPHDRGGAPGDVAARAGDPGAPRERGLEKHGGGPRRQATTSCAPRGSRTTRIPRPSSTCSGAAAETTSRAGRTRATTASSSRPPAPPIPPPATHSTRRPSVSC